MSPKIAILIDAENISYKILPYILGELPRHGQIILRAVYGDWQSPALQRWRVIAQKNDFKIRHQTNAAQTKNSSDMKLIMDAMEVLYRTPADIFCLVTNDADYVPLCDKIHEAKKRVIGVGCKHASEALIRACDQFIFIECGSVPVSVEASISLSKQSPILKSPNQLNLRKLLSKAFAEVPQAAGKWVTLSALGAALHQVQAEFQTSDYGHVNLTALLQSMPDFVAFQDNGSIKTVRLKNITIKRRNPNSLPKLLTKAFAKAPQEADGWVKLSALGSALRQVQAGFQTTDYGYTNLTALLQSRPDFVVLRAHDGTKSARLNNTVTSKHSKLNDQQKLLSKAFAKTPQEADGWVKLSALGSALRQVQAGFKPNNYGHATLSKLLQSMPGFVVLRTKGGVKSARLKK